MKIAKGAAALFFAALITIFSVTSGLPQSPPPSGHATVEGTWEITWEQPGIVSLKSQEKRSLVGKRVTIRLKSPGEYEAKWQDGKTEIYHGSPTEIHYVLTRTLEDLRRSLKSTPEVALKGLVGVQTKDYLRLSPDGRTLFFLQEGIKVRYEAHTGQLGTYWITPPKAPATILTLVSEPAPTPQAARVPAPPASAAAPAKKTAASPMAQVEARGEFYFLTKDGRKLTGAEANKVPLKEGSKVVTGKGGHVRLTLPDATTFTVGANSEIVIDKFVYDPDQSPKKIMVDMTKGVFRWVTGKTAPKYKPQMQVTLPVMAVGIRGTDFEALVGPKGRGRVALYDGQLEITEKKTGFTFILNAGQMVTFTPDGKVSRPKKIKAAPLLDDEEDE